METQRAHLSINRKKCAPCSGLICVGVCPQGLLELDQNGKPRLTNSAECSLCGVCVDLCPSKAITLALAEEGKTRR